MGEVDPNKSDFKHKRLKHKSKVNMPVEKETNESIFHEDKGYNKFPHKELNSAATMYGNPSPLEMKSHPLYKKGKMSPCYNQDPKWFEFKKKKEAKEAKQAAIAARTEAIKEGTKDLDPAVVTTSSPEKSGDKKKTRHIPTKF